MAMFIGTGILVTALAMLTGDAEDLLFILYFETFPEHWHGNFNFLDLISRIPSFYGHWALYTGGGLLLALPFLWGTRTPARTNLQWIMGCALGYSSLLATIDHHPSHYYPIHLVDQCKPSPFGTNLLCHQLYHYHHQCLHPYRDNHRYPNQQ